MDGAAGQAAALLKILIILADTRARRIRPIAAATPSPGQGPVEGNTLAALRLCWITVSAVRHVHSQAAERCFFVLLVHVMAGLAHGLNTDIKADKMLTITAQRKAGR